MSEFNELGFRVTTDAAEYGRISVIAKAGGRLDAKFRTVVAALGEPSFVNEAGKPFPDDDYKVDVCWGVVGADGQSLAIYNYKNGPAYNRGEGLTLDDIDWFAVDFTNASKQLFDIIAAIIKGAKGHGESMDTLKLTEAAERNASASGDQRSRSNSADVLER